MVKPIWILLKQETVSGSGISWAICKSAPRSRQITTPAPHHSVFTGQMPFLLPNQQRQCTESKLDLSGDKVLTDSVLLFDKPSVSVEDLLQYNRQVKLDRVVRQLSIILHHHTQHGNVNNVKVKVVHARLPSVGFRSWSYFLAVSLQVMCVINLVVGCHYFPPGLQLPSQPLRGLLPISLVGEQRHDECKQFA